MEEWRRNFRLVWLNNFATAVGMMAFLPLFPFYVKELGVEDPARQRIWAGVLVAGAPLTAAIMGPFWGALGDRVGRRWMLIRANFAICLFVGLMSIASTPWTLLALRLGQGVFSGFMAPAMTLVSVAAPAERQGRVAGLLHTAVLAGSMGGPPLGGFVADHVGYRAVFLVTAALSALALTTTLLFVREEPVLRSAERGEVPSLFGLIRKVIDDIGGLLKIRSLRWILGAVFTLRLSSHMVEPNLGLFVEGLDGFDPAFLNTATGFTFAATGVATLVMTPFWGRFGDRRGPTRTLAFCAVGAGLFYLPQALVHHVVPLYALRFATGAFLSGIFPAAYSVAARYSTRENRGGAHGMTFSSLAVANALAPALGGTLAAVLGLRPLFVLSSVLMLIAGWRVWRHRTPTAADRATAQSRAGA